MKPLWREGTRKAIARANDALAVQRVQASEMPLPIMLEELKRRGVLRECECGTWAVLIGYAVSVLGEPCLRQRADEDELGGSEDGIPEVHPERPELSHSWDGCGECQAVWDAQIAYDIDRLGIDEWQRRLAREPVVPHGRRWPPMGDGDE